MAARRRRTEDTNTERDELYTSQLSSSQNLFISGVDKLLTNASFMEDFLSGSYLMIEVFCDKASRDDCLRY